jgi:hypothetical protein
LLIWGKGVVLSSETDQRSQFGASATWYLRKMTFRRVMILPIAQNGDFQGRKMRRIQTCFITSFALFRVASFDVSAENAGAAMGMAPGKEGSAARTVS